MLRDGKACEFMGVPPQKLKAPMKNQYVSIVVIY
jgi:hypothetical protein